MDGNWFYLLIPMAAALTASLALTPLVRGLARRLHVMAYPDAQRRFHPGPMPLLGGVAVYFAMLAGLAAALLLERFRQPDLARLCRVLVPVAAMACLFGAIDDWRTLRSRAKLALQFLAALSIVAAGFSVQFITLFGFRIELGWWGPLLTVCWIMGCINALNLIDGLDGLASLVGISTTTTMGIIALSMNNSHVAAVAFSLAAALAGFLAFNRPPASVFLGDSGSTLIGLVIGVLGIQGSLKSSATLSITAPVVLMTVPMFDVLMAVVRRRLTGQPLALGDREHIHHCLLRRGLGPWQVLAVPGALCVATGAAATFATIFCMEALAWIIAGMLIVLMVRLRIFGHREFDLIYQSVRRQSENLAQSVFFHRSSPPLQIDAPCSLEPKQSKTIQRAPGMRSLPADCCEAAWSLAPVSRTTRDLPQQAPLRLASVPTVSPSSCRRRFKLSKTSASTPTKHLTSPPKSYMPRELIFWILICPRTKIIYDISFAGKFASLVYIFRGTPWKAPGIRGSRLTAISPG